MLLVVVVHVHHKLYLPLDWDVSHPVEKAWSAFNLAMTPMRIPLFFAVSGIFVASAVQRSWKSGVHGKILNPIYLYVLWITLSAGLYKLIGSRIDGFEVTSISSYLSLLVVPTSSLWYMYALAVYFFVTKFTSKVPAAAVVLAAAVLSVAAFEWAGDGTPARVLQNLVFFVAAARARDIFIGISAKANLIRSAIGVGLYALIVALYVAEIDQVLGVRTLAAFGAIWSGITIITVISRFAPIGRSLQFIGQNTLPIYVVHVPLIAITAWVIGPNPAWNDSLIIASIFPVVIAAIVTGFALAIHRGLLVVHAGWLYSLPRFPSRKGIAADELHAGGR